jgi:hypothetical protein
MYPFPPSSFHLFIYLRKKKTLTSTLLPLNSKKKKKEKNQGAPYARIIPIASAGLFGKW